MFKLVAVGGKLRGKEFILKDGENILGRASECDHPIQVDGVSKRHLQVTVNGDTAFAEDLGSSNGTIVNGKIIKKMTIKDGDKVALPNVILQVVYVLEKKVIVKKKVVKAGDSEEDAYNDQEHIEPMPSSLIAKPIWIFKHKIMPIIYSFNEQYEWSALVGILIFIFIAINITLTILPVLRDSKGLLIKEIALRGKQYAAEVDRLNNVFLRDKSLDQVYTGFLEGDDAEGVQSYKLFDIEGRIYRPVSELNTIVNDSFSVEAMKFYRVEKNQDREIIQDLGNNVIGIARAIKAHDKTLGQEIRFQTERVLRGRQKELNSKVLFREIHPLRNTINSILTRIKELQNTDSGESQALEEDGPYLRTLKEFMVGSHGPVMILNSEKIIQHLNLECEDLIGIRENASAGQSILDSARDQGFAATVIDLCDQSANNEGCNQKEVYEIGGKQINVNVSALIGKDKFAKGFYITFVRND